MFNNATISRRCVYPLDVFNAWLYQNNQIHRSFSTPETPDSFVTRFEELQHIIA